MKKVLVMLAAIMFCGATMVSCNKEENTIETTSASTDVNPADLIGSWIGEYNGSALYGGDQMNYKITWTVNLSTVSAGTISANVNTPDYEPQNTAINYIITGVRPRQNTDYVILDVRRDGALFDDTFEMLYNKSARTLKGNMTLLFQENLNIGGETTLNKQ